VLPVVATAQTAIDSVCHARLVDEFKPSDPYWAARSVGVAAASTKPLEAGGMWREALAQLSGLFREDSSLFSDTGTPSLSDYFRVLRELEALNAVLTDATLMARIGLEGAPRFLVQENAGNTYRLLDNAVSIPPDADVNRARSLCLIGHNVTRYHQRFNLPGREAAERELAARVSRWNSFNERGLTPFPWELSLNEALRWLGSRKPLEPPNLQLIAARPSAAIEVDNKFGNRKNVLAVEVIGLARYFGSRSAYVSGSLLVVAPSEAPAGWGALVRIAPWMITGGPLWRDADDDGDRDLRWVLSIDAFDLLSSAPKSLLEAAKLATGGRARQ
jgi:hypothetical protein